MENKIRAIKVEETVGNESTYVNRLDLSAYLVEQANKEGFASEARAALLEVITRLSDVKYTRPNIHVLDFSSKGE